MSVHINLCYPVSLLPPPLAPFAHQTRRGWRWTEDSGGDARVPRLVVISPPLTLHLIHTLSIGLRPTDSTLI